MTQSVRRILMSTAALVCMLAFQNCSNGVDFDQVSESTGGQGLTCRVSSVKSTETVKILFLLDASGSNKYNVNDINKGTDSDKSWRLRTINSFLNNYKNHTNFEYAFAYFKGSTASSLLGTGTIAKFTKDATEIDQAISNFENLRDEGSTPYDAALNLVKNSIEFDKANSSVAAGYAVLMVSDGSPSNSSYTGSMGDENLTRDVASIISVAPEQISLNTVYYYNPAYPSGSKTIYLEKIARLGNGVFHRAESSSTVEITDSIQIPQTICD